MSFAPIALFTYSRAEHTRKVVETLLKNREASSSDLYIFSDGPKTEDKSAAVEEVRQYIHTIKGFKSIYIIEHKENQGLANSLINGITEVVNKHGRVIVIEDDLILSPFFLQYMNEALDTYAEEDKVSAISAFLNPTDTTAPDTFFLRYFACWGWATWKRSWDLINFDAKDLLRQMRWREREFDIDGEGGFYDMLLCQKLHLIDSWAIRFYASSFLADKLVLFPNHSLCLQNGMDGTGTHSEDVPSLYKNVTMASSPINITLQPLKESKDMYAAFARYYAELNPDKGLRKQYHRLKSFVRRLLYMDCM